MSDPQNQNPKDDIKLREPEQDDTYDSTTTALKLEADTDSDLKTILASGADSESPLQTTMVDGSSSAQTNGTDGAKAFAHIEPIDSVFDQLQSIPTPDYKALGVIVVPMAEGLLGPSASFEFPDALQIRGKFGIKTDFTKTPAKAPSFNGETIKSLTVMPASKEQPSGTVVVETKDGTRILSPLEQRRFEFPSVFSFTDPEGNHTSILANGDKHIVRANGSRLIQFNPFDREGRQFQTQLVGSNERVTYFQDGRRQLSFEPPRADGMALLTEHHDSKGTKYESRFLTPPSLVPQRLADTLEALQRGAGDQQKLEAVKTLAELELQSDDARIALEKFASESPQNLGLVRYARFNQAEGPSGVLIGIGSLPSLDRLEVIRAAAKDLETISDSRTLTPEQLKLATRGMAFSLYDGRDEMVKGNPRPVSEQLSSIIEKNMNGPGRASTMKAVVDMIELGSKPTINRLAIADAFVPLVLRGAKDAALDGNFWKDVRHHLSTVEQLSKDGNRTATTIVNAIADGGTTYTRPKQADSEEAPAEFFVSAEYSDDAEYSDEGEKSAATKVDSRTAAAQRVFGDDLSTLMSGAAQIPEDGSDYKKHDHHQKVAGMVSEFLKGNDRALADLRIEAGRPDWTGASSVAPSAFHRVSVVKAVLDLEKAIESGDREQQKDALRELAKLRSIKLGGENDFAIVHKAIDDYLKIRTEQQPELIGRDQFNEMRRRSEERLKETFKQSAGSFTAFLTATDTQKREQALEAFQKSVNENPDSKLLEWSSRLGDYGSALNLKQQAGLEKPDPNALRAALERLEQSSPPLAADYLADVLKSLKEDPHGGAQFANVETLDMNAVRELLRDGKHDILLPHLKKSLETGQIKELFDELDALRSSNHSPLDLLKAGRHRDKNDFDQAVEYANENARQEEKDLRLLEAAFLKRGATQDERDRVIEQLRQRADQSQLMIGSTTGPDAYRLEQISKVLGLKESQNPVKAAEYLVALKDARGAGNPYAQTLLDKLTAGQPEKVDEMITTLQSGGDASNELLKKLEDAAKFIDADLDTLRLENLTWNFKSTKAPTPEELGELETVLKVERENGNDGVETWLQWCDATKLVLPLKAGSGLTKEARLENIKQLGELSRNGNDHARKALLAVLVDSVAPQARAYWNAEFNSETNPRAVRPSLPDAVQADSHDYAAAAAKAMVTIYDGKADQLGSSEALALSLALGRWADRSVISADIESLLKRGLEGKNGDAVLSGTFTALNINAPGGDAIARAILHGANRPELTKFVPNFVNWAEKGDKVGMQILAGLLAKTEDPKIIKVAGETFNKIAGDKRNHQPALEALLHAYDTEVKQTDLLKKTGRGNPALVEILGDVLGKVDKEAVPQKLFTDTKNVLLNELTFFNKNPNERDNPDQKNRYEYAVRGFISSAKNLSREDITLLRATPQLAKALQEKDWHIPNELAGVFKGILQNDVQVNPINALACLSKVGKILTSDDISTTMRLLPRERSEEVEMATMKFLLATIGDSNSSSAVKNQALKEIERHEWKSPKLDTHLRECLSEYLKGRVGDIKQLDRVIALVGDIGIEPPMALVLSRLGLPLDEHTIWEVEEGLRNFDGDRAAYAKVIQHAVTVNALPKELNVFGPVDIKGLVQRMADGPLEGSEEFGFLLGDKVPKVIESLEDAQYDVLQRESELGGMPMSRLELHDAIFVHPFKRPGAARRNFLDGQLDQSIQNLQQTTRDGHGTSYWWLALGGAGYLARRFGPGGTEDQFKAKQKDAIDAWQSAKKAATDSSLKTNTMISGLVQLDTAKKVGEYARLLTSGSVIKSDELALTIASRMGSQALKTNVPFIYSALEGTPSDPSLGIPAKAGEIWERLRRNHATDLKVAPIFGEEFLGFDDALRFLQRPELKQPDLKTYDRYHFLSGKAHELALTEAFKAVDSNPDFLKVMDSYGKLMGVNSSMEMLFQMGMGGYKGDEFVTLARKLADGMEKAMWDLQKQKPLIDDLIAELKQASDKAVDPDAKKGLDARVTQLQEMLKMIPGTNDGKNDERFDVTKQMIRLIRSADFDSESFLKFMKDNGPILIWSTIAVAGVLAMPFSGGLSGALTAVAVSALIATVSYLAVETYKEGMHQVGGAAYGSDFLRAVGELATGNKLIQQDLRYDPQTGKFKAPPTMNEAIQKGLEQIAKDTALNLIGAGFGKLLSVAAKGVVNPATKLAARELATDAKLMVDGLNKVAAKNIAASTYGGRFTKIFFESLPLGVVGATTDAIVQDQLKTIKDNKELAEFGGHVATICLTVLFHRVGGHLMTPKTFRNGNIEIPYDRNKFIDAMKQEYAKSGKPMPKMRVDGETVKFDVGGKMMELRFVDPAKVAAALDAAGVKPRPMLPGEELRTVDEKPMVPEEQKPGSVEPPVVPAEKPPAAKPADVADPALPKQNLSTSPTPPSAESIKPTLEALAREGTGEGKLSATNKDAGKEANANRQYLEKAVKDGSITPDQFNRLMSLNTFDLSIVLKSMRENILSPKAMDTAMQWSPEHREALLNTSKIHMKTVSLAVERGLLDGPAIEALNAKVSAEKTNAFEILSELVNEPTASPASVGRLMKLGSEELANIRRAMQGEELSFNNKVKLSAKQLVSALSTDLAGERLNKLVSTMMREGISADTVRTLVECRSVEKILDMPVDQRREVIGVISGQRLSARAADVLVKRVLNQSSGNPVVDSILKPDLLNPLLEKANLGDSSAAGHLANLLSVAAEHTTGGTPTRPIEILQKLATLSPGSSHATTQMIRNGKMSAKDLTKIMDELATISDALTQADRANAHAKLSTSSPEFHQKLLAVEPVTLRGGLTSAASRGHLTVEQLPKILEQRSSSPEASKFVDQLLSDRSNINKIEIIENMQGKALSAPELTQLTELIGKGKMTLHDVRATLKLPNAVRSQTLEILKTKAIENIEELLSVSADNDASALLIAMGRDQLRLSDATRIMQKSYSGEKADALHAEQLRAVLRGQKDAPTLTADNIQAMIKSSKSASDAAMQVPEQFHTNATTKLQAQEFKRVEALKDGDAKEALLTFVREKLPALHMGDPRMLDATGLRAFEAGDYTKLKAHFDWLVEGLSGKGTGKYPSVAELETLAFKFPESTIMIAAYEAGIRTPAQGRNAIPEGDFEVFLHGTDVDTATAMIKGNGGTLSETYVSKKGVAGEFFTTQSVRVGRAYSKEASRGDKPGAVVAIAIPKKVAAELRAKGWLKDGDFVKIENGQIDLVRGGSLDNVAGSEKVFSKEAMAYLRSKGFFFELDVKTQPAAKQSETAPVKLEAGPDKPATTPGGKPAVPGEKPTTGSGTKLNTDAGDRKPPEAARTDSKTFNAKLEAARQEYLKNPTDPTATTKLTELLQESINEQYRVHGIPVEFAPKVSIEPSKSGEHPTSDFSNETYRVRIGEGRLETRNGTVHDPKHEGFHAILCLNRTAAYMHNRPAYMAKLTEAWAADLKAGYDIAGPNGITRPADQGARSTAYNLLEPVLKPYSKGITADVEARAALDQSLATTNGAAQLKTLARKMGVTPEQAKEYLHKELNNFFRLERWHILPEAILKTNPQLKAYLESIGEKQSNQLGRLIDPLVNTHRGLFDPEVYKFSSPEEHRARVRQYSEELKVLLENRGKGAKGSQEAQNLIANIQEQSRLWQLHEQLRKLESVSLPADIKGHLEQIQKLAESLKKDLSPDDPLLTYLSLFDRAAAPVESGTVSPQGNNIPRKGPDLVQAKAANDPRNRDVNEGKTPTKKSVEKPAGDGKPKQDAPDASAPDAKAVIDLFGVMLADAPKTNYGELLGKVRDGKFTPAEIEGLAKLARRDGSEVIDRILKLPAEARNAKLNELIKNASDADTLRLPLATAEVELGISRMDSSYRDAMTDLISKPGGLDLARRILMLPEELVRQEISPDSFSKPDFAATLNKAEVKHVEAQELARRGGKPPLKVEEVLKPDQLERYKAIQEKQKALGDAPLKLADTEIASRAEAYMKGEGHAKESLPTDGVIKRGKTLHIVLGAPGAGKSKSIVDGLKDKYGARLIDSDLIKPDLPGYKGGLGTQTTHLASDAVATAVRDRAYANGENIVQPVVGRTYEGIHAMIRRARANGYDVAIHLADITPTKSVERVFDRGYARDPVEGGVQQVIPMSYPLELVGFRPEIVFDHLVKTPGLVDAWTKYNTMDFPGKLVGKSSRELPPMKPGTEKSEDSAK